MGPESICPVVVMDSGLACASLRRPGMTETEKEDQALTAEMLPITKSTICSSEGPGLVAHWAMI